MQAKPGIELPALDFEQGSLRLAPAGAGGECCSSEVAPRVRANVTGGKTLPTDVV